jgi:Glycosyl transferases group 1
MIEAMACGTPIIAYRSGSVPEVIEDGVPGFIVEGEDQAVEAVKEVARLDIRKVRARFEERFTASRMARAYEAHYGNYSPAGLARAVSRKSRPDPGFNCSSRVAFFSSSSSRIFSADRRS